MFDVITDLVASLNNVYVISALVLAAVLLILFDYVSTTDWPAHVGYICFALAVFLLAPYGWLGSIVCGVGTWAILWFLHWKLLYKFLSDDGAPVADGGVGEVPASDRSGHEGDR
jgi:hypothetical protein